MAVLPIQPTPFFENKNRAFWNLQLLGWSGAFLLRTASAVAGRQDLDFFIVIAIEMISGFCISLVLSVVYQKLMNRRPVITWTVSLVALSIAVAVLTVIDSLVISLYNPNSETSFATLVIGILVFPTALLGAWSALYYAINFYLKIEQQTDRMLRLEAQAASAQLAMLRYQLNPHFLFNTLNSISTLVLLKQSEAANAMLSRLSDFLRHTLVTEPTGKVTLNQEIETLKLYLDIERMRFEDRLRTKFHVQHEAADACLPALLLQPLVENAIKYAVSVQEEGARISIEARKIGDRLRITVSDTGPGLQGPENEAGRKAGIASTGVGLKNIRNRLQQAYGDDHRFEIRAAEEGFVVIVELPYEYSGGEETQSAPSVVAAAKRTALLSSTAD